LRVLALEDGDDTLEVTTQALVEKALVDGNLEWFAVRGAVQGVGFRPHVFRLARELGVTGWISNDADGVRIEIEGARPVLERFRARLRADPPPAARVTGLTEAWLEPVGYTDFRIRESRAGGTPGVAILPDLATCPLCLADVRRPGDRRRGYPFTNCTSCGPRFRIVRKLPYDRPNTTMVGFLQCPACLEEYTTPADRRFHAQPNACPVCGPHLQWWPVDAEGGEGAHPEGPAFDATSILACAQALRAGRLVAVQGLGGFHLMADAESAEAVQRLRARKGREAKPLAVMVADLAAAEALVEVDEEARTLLTSPAAPIVLLDRRPEAAVAPSVAPGNPTLGVMLAYTPLHHLLLEAVGRPVVATSGNRSEEPICIRPEEARDRLGGIAEAFLVHDRPIERHVDDSVTRIGPEGPQVLRRARGYAPLPLPLPTGGPSILAVGGHLKNTIAVARDGQAWVSQHIGDLETHEARNAFRTTVEDFLRLYEVQPVVVAHDLHPDYASTRWAQETWGDRASLIPVQHHHAHLAALVAEHAFGPDGAAEDLLSEPVLGIVWDGTGYGPDGTIWGGEFLLGGLVGFERAGHLRRFRLPGGDAAVREPRRSALGLLQEAGLLDHPGAGTVLNAFTDDERRVLQQLLVRGVRAPVTSSAGRLFDGLASILGICHASRFEGDAPMQLEFAAAPGESGAYPMAVRPSPEGGWILDWAPLLEALLDDRSNGVPVSVAAARIHEGLAEGITRLVAALDAETVGLSGGCFLNARLTQGAWHRLRAAGHRVLLHREIPPGDGGISLGQAAVATMGHPGSAPGAS
jgi:hydrogenase maturation protein HypF